ncbi:MAG: hypothetical protein WC758_08035 [Candidatus Woesearchaeota archaeon]|jgi:hypothetical protein
MNKNLFWTGIVFQSIHLLVIMLLFLTSLNWSFVNGKVLLGASYLIFNIVSLAMIFVGALKRE